jgi:hypothetical protein
MNTYTWVISALDCVPSLDGRTNVVSVAHWRLNATDGNHTVTSYGTQYLGYANSNAFIAYSDLTNETVIGWVQTAMGDEQVQAIQSSLDNQIEKLITPTIISPPLPWETV